MPDRILIVDDEPNITLSFSSLLRDEGYRTETAASAEEALGKTERLDFSLILLDLNLPGQSGIDFLKKVSENPLAPPTLIISGQSDIPTALEAMKLGAVDYIEKPVSPERLISSVNSALMLAQANRQRNLLVDDIDNRSRIIGDSRPMRKLLKTVSQVAPTDTTVLITGENGTGKELVATRIYLESKRRDKPFIKVNCPGIPSTLFESELFGHTRGAFTGAVKDYPGKFALADGGTIFLDEIGDLPLDCQAKLLRVLETGEIERLGSIEGRQVDVRVVCASNRDISQLLSEKRFREDLYYRISVFVISVPPLRERPDDVPPLAGEFLKRFDPAGRTRLSPESMAHLAGLKFPGNVRQLKNIIERLTILFAGRTIGVNDLISQLSHSSPTDTTANGDLSLAQKVSNFEKYLIKQALEQSQGNISRVARVLQVDRANLSKKVKELGLKE